MDSPDTVTLPVRFRTIADAPAADVVFAAIYADRVPVVWLDSNAEGDPLSRFSFMADVADPLSYAVRYRSKARELEIIGRSVVRQCPSSSKSLCMLATDTGPGPPWYSDVASTTPVAFATSPCSVF